MKESKTNIQDSHWRGGGGWTLSDSSELNGKLYFLGN